MHWFKIIWKRHDAARLNKYKKFSSRQIHIQFAQCKGKFLVPL